MPTFLMSRPRYYEIAYEINPWMKLERPVDGPLARRQWQVLYGTLRRMREVRVRLINPVRGWPDMVFTANGGLVVGRDVFLSNFRYRQRRGETRHFAAWFKKHRYRVVRLHERLRFEGEGDALRVGENWFFGYHFRSDIAAHQWMSGRLRARVLSLELVNKRFYHLDTCFLPLDGRSCLYYPKAFDHYARRLISSFVPDPIPVPLADAKRFVCNGVVVGKKLVVQEGVSRGVRRALKQRGFTLVELDLTEFLKAGGSSKCLVLTL